MAAKAGPARSNLANQNGSGWSTFGPLPKISLQINFKKPGALALTSIFVKNLLDHPLKNQGTCQHVANACLVLNFNMAKGFEVQIAIISKEKLVGTSQLN